MWNDFCFVMSFKPIHTNNLVLNIEEEDNTTWRTTKACATGEKGRCYWLKRKGWNFDLSKQFLMVQIIRATGLHTHIPQARVIGSVMADVCRQLSGTACEMRPELWEASGDLKSQMGETGPLTVSYWGCRGLGSTACAASWLRTKHQSSLWRENTQGMLILILKVLVTMRKGATSTLR